METRSKTKSNKSKSNSTSNNNSNPYSRKMMQASFDILEKQAEKKVDESIFTYKIGSFVGITKAENRGQLLYPILVIAGLPKVSGLCIRREYYVKHINAKESIINFENNLNNVVFANVNGNGSDGGGYIHEKNLILIISDPFRNISKAKTDIIGYLEHANRKNVLKLGKELHLGMKQLFLDAGYKMSKKTNRNYMTGPLPDAGVPFPEQFFDPLFKMCEKYGIYFYQTSKNGRSETHELNLSLFTKAMPQTYCTNVENGTRYTITKPKMILDKNLENNQFIIKFGVISRNIATGDIINMRG